MLLLLVGCGAQTVKDDPPAQRQETTAVKAVWIPFMEVERLLGSDDPKAAIDACLADCAGKGANTVYFHVRANADAYYASEVYPINPAAEPLIERGIDPLVCAIESAKAYSLSLHAWVNPYRIGTDASRVSTDDCFAFNGKYYYDPAADSTHELVIRGVREIVSRYDVDGVQFDDYFYPENAVPDSAPAAFEESRYTAYLNSGGSLSVADWRRRHVSALIAAVYNVCHEREGCMFGVSPAYDIDRNRELLYADVAAWAKTAGYVDYLCPQLYFGFCHEYAPFDELLNRWNELERDASVALVGGLGLYKTGLAVDTYAGSGKTEWAQHSDIIARQMDAVTAAGWDGTAVYSHLSFEADETRDSAIVAAESAALCDKWKSAER